jgi:hypothetical protein
MLVWVGKALDQAIATNNSTRMSHSIIYHQKTYLGEETGLSNKVEKKKIGPETQKAIKS